MKIVHLVAGAGGMYCGSCMHGNTLVIALREAGQDVLLAPVYTPLRTDEENASVDRVMYGGINVYLQQLTALFRHTPWFIDWLWDRPSLLRWIGKRSESTRPEHLGALTVSMLRGEEGLQKKELTKLIRWLQRDVKPELIHLSNVMLSGMARQLSDQLHVPVVCTLSGEDLFLEQLREPYYSHARAVLRERAGDLAGMVAMNNYYADFMAEYLSVPRPTIHVIPPGLNLSGHGSRDGSRIETDQSPGQSAGAGWRPVTIGYLSRICHEKGLHQLAEAFLILCADPSIPPIRLLAAGYMGENDRPYLEQIQKQFGELGLANRFQYVGELDRAEKIAFLQSLDVMSVPTVYRESKGLPVLEAWANGVPVVLPEHGAFPELVRDTGGGLLCAPHSPPALAKALKQMILEVILEPQLAADIGRQAQEAVHQRYHAPLMAKRTIEWYRTLLRTWPGGRFGRTP